MLKEMTPQEKQEIKEWNHKARGEVEIHFVSTPDPRSAVLEAFCSSLAESASRIRIIFRDAKEGETLPAILLPRGIQYRALPLGRELPPFLEALGPEKAEIPESLRKRLSLIRTPISLRLYIARNCPFCPRTVRQLLPMAVHGQQIRLQITDAEMFPEKASADDVRSVPVLIWNPHFRRTGNIHAEEIAAVLAERNPAHLSADSLEQMLTEGRAGDLTAMMLEHKTVFPALADLLCHEKWPLRLGAMVSAESLAEQDRALAGQINCILWEKFHSADEGAKGDMLYIIGICGSRKDIPYLSKIEQGEFSKEIREAAAEAIARIQEEI